MLTCLSSQSKLDNATIVWATENAKVCKQNDSLYKLGSYMFDLKILQRMGADNIWGLAKLNRNGTSHFYSPILMNLVFSIIYWDLCLLIVFIMLYYVCFLLYDAHKMKTSNHIRLALAAQDGFYGIRIRWNRFDGMDWTADGLDGGWIRRRVDSTADGFDAGWICGDTAKKNRNFAFFLLLRFPGPNAWVCKGIW